MYLIFYLRESLPGEDVLYSSRSAILTNEHTSSNDGVSNQDVLKKEQYVHNYKHKFK